MIFTNTPVRLKKLRPWLRAGPLKGMPLENDAPFLQICPKLNFIHEYACLLPDRSTISEKLAKKHVRLWAHRSTGVNIFLLFNILPKTLLFH